MKLDDWRKGLMGVTGAVMVYALGLMLMPGVMHGLFTTLFFGGADAIQSLKELEGDEGRFITLVYGVLGAVMLGWMAGIMWMLVRGFRSNPREVWATLTFSVVVWFVVDSGFSVVTGFVEHALFNVAFVVMYAIPLIGMGRALYSR